ncbi:MAG: holo-ACP synthase [Synergistaceae bacterium]|nr:holo-ACP synthase [Synergistota bacterium]NLM70661.1 holo-ACP synthase [Synergistaceae bacterium]
MIIGIGVDLCSIARMERAIRSDRFVQRVFSSDEISYALDKARPARHFAACFAAREAFAKASGIPMYALAFGGGIRLERTDAAPLIRVADSIKDKMPLGGSEKIFLSISHEGDYAVAMVVLEAVE